MFLFTYSAAVLAFLCFGTAAFVFLKKKDSSQARYFAWYLLWLGVWVGGNAGADLTVTEFSAKAWSAICLIGGCFFISSYILFVEHFITEKPLNRLKKICIVGPGMILSALGFTPLYVKEVIITYTEPTGMILGDMNYAALVYIFGGMAYVITRLILAYQKAHALKQKQLFYLAAGFIFLPLGAIYFTIYLPLQGEFRFFTLGPQFALFTILFSAYAIFKHQLLDIKVAIQRGLIYTILLASIVSVYVAILFITLFTVETTTTIPYLASGIITTIFGIFTVPLIEQKLRRWTDRFFFKDKYDFSEVIHQLGIIVSKYNRLDELTLHAGEELKRILRTDNVCFSLTEKYTQANALEPWQTADSTASLWQPSLSMTEQEINHPWVMRVPLVLVNECIGILFVGQKLSGEQYSNEDVRLMNAFSRYMAIALNKALLYQTVIDYSENLTQKVGERTKEIQAMQESQAKLMLDISHELQTPLTIIKGEVGLLREKLTDTSSINVFEKSVDRISTFIRAMLKLAKLEAAGENTAKLPVNLSVLIHEVVEYVTVMAEAEKITLTASIEEDLITLGNREQLEQLITNLLSNAIKYIANNRSIMVTAKHEGAIISLTVHDSGIGIASENLPHLFKRFNRFGTAKDGTGLGLALCDTIAKNHGGAITVQSELGQGTTFTVNLKSFTV